MTADTETLPPLVVAHPVPTGESGVLSTAVPMPTDGLPEWWQCETCGRGRRLLEPGEKPLRGLQCRTGFADEVPNGPFPVTVGRWEPGPHVVAEDAPAVSRLLTRVTGRPAAAKLPTVSVEGAIVELLTVTGPSVRGNESGDDQGCHCDDQATCTPCSRWHTPVQTVTTLDVPAPMERPGTQHGPRAGDWMPPPAVWWVPTMKAGA